MQDSTWKEWMVAAQKGDKRSYERLLASIAAHARSVLIPTLSNPSDTEDIVQEVLMSVHKSLHTYSPGRPVRPWVGAIIQFRRTDYLRRHYASRQNVKVDIDTAEISELPVTIYPHAGEYKDIEAALAGLPHRQRRVFEMVKVEGYSALDVARLTGMTITSVKVTAHRAMRKLQSRLK